MPMSKLSRFLSSTYHCFSQKQINIFISFLCMICFTLTGCSNSTDSYHGETSSSNNTKFEEFTQELFSSELSSNTLNLHYTVENPSSYDINNYEITLGNLSSEYRKTSISCLKNTKSTLSEFSDQSLSLQEQLTYDILNDYLDSQIALSDYELYEEILTPNNGIQSQLPILYAEYTFRCKQDVEDYLNLISTTDDYFSQIIDFEKEKIKAGLFMSDQQCCDVIESCENFLKQQDDNFLFTTFDTKIASVPDIDESEMASYIDANHTAVTTHVFPAYELLIKELTHMLGCGQNNWGLCNYKNGADYYALLVSADTGSKKSMEELEEMIDSKRDMDLSICSQLLSQNPSLPEECSNFVWNYTDENSILNRLQTTMISDFPAPSNTNYTISYVDDCLQDSLAPAFYITAPIDNYNTNRIYVNSAKGYSNINYFTTLAHEGFPGHLYQTVMSYEYGLSPVRTILNYPGYIEGWATYVEMISYYYAGLDEDVAALLQHNQSATLSLYATSDIGIHYYGWKSQELYDFWSTYGITDTDAIDEIAQLIISEPGNYLKYYVGYLEFEELRSYAEEYFGDSYSKQNFHKAILTMGPAPFSILQQYLDQFYEG